MLRGFSLVLEAKVGMMLKSSRLEFSARQAAKNHADLHDTYNDQILCNENEHPP